MYSNSCHFFDQEWRCCEHLYTVQLGFWNMLVCPLIWHLVHFKPVPKQWNDQHILTDLCLHDINTYKDHQYQKKSMVGGNVLEPRLGPHVRSALKTAFSLMAQWPNSQTHPNITWFGIWYVYMYHRIKRLQILYKFAWLAGKKLSPPETGRAW